MRRVVCLSGGRFSGDIRRVVTGARGMVMTAAGPVSASPDAASAKPLHELSARDAARAMAAGTLTAEAYVEALLDWQARWSVLNVYTQQDAAAARAAARRAAQIR